ncbi:hypothetical protein SMICM304S_09204 [Streptomyces microflavus]
MRTLLERVGWEPAEVDHFVPHQANARILRAVADRVGIGPQRCVTHLDRVGNTGAASIPLALADAAGRGVLRGDRVLLTAFGGGLTWGSAALRWPGTPQTDFHGFYGRNTACRSPLIRAPEPAPAPPSR